MDDTKRAYRETEEGAKEAWRNCDGEDLADRVGNLGDDVRKELGNLGDDARKKLGSVGERLDPNDPRHGSIDDPADPVVVRDQPR
jgi:hypothetical protein